MKKLKESSSPLLNRTQVTYEVEHFQKATPKKEDLKQILAKELKLSPEQIHLKHIFSHFGSSKSKLIADVYKSAEDLKKYVKIKKKKGEGEEQTQAQPAPKEKEGEVKAVSSKEEKKNE